MAYAVTLLLLLLLLLMMMMIMTLIFRVWLCDDGVAMVTKCGALGEKLRPVFLPSDAPNGPAQTRATYKSIMLQLSHL
jgi:hypothetical protein